MIAHDCRIAENTANDRHMETLFSDQVIVSKNTANDRHMETLFSDRVIVSDRQRLYGNTFQRSGDCRRSAASLRFSDYSDSAIVSDHIETRLNNALKITSS